MALNVAQLTATIQAAFIAGGAAPIPQTIAMCAGIAAAIITQFQTNAVVLPTLLIAPGGLSPAPVTGTGNVT